MNLEKEEKFDWIDRYLRGELDAQEIIRFNAMLSENEDFKRELDLHREVHLAVTDVRLQKFITAIKEADQRYKSSSPKWLRIGMPVYLKIAAAVTVLTCASILLWNLLTPGPDALALYQAHFTPYPAPVNFRSDASPYTNENWVMALRAYDERRYEEAIPLFSAEIAGRPANKLAVLLRGVSYLSANDLAKAQGDFTTLRDEKNLMFNEQATWYLALSFLKQGNEERCKEFLRSLENSKLSGQASKLLDQLE